MDSGYGVGSYKHRASRLPRAPAGAGDERWRFTASGAPGRWFFCGEAGDRGHCSAGAAMLMLRSCRSSDEAWRSWGRRRLTFMSAVCADNLHAISRCKSRSRIWEDSIRWWIFGDHRGLCRSRAMGGRKLGPVMFGSSYCICSLSPYRACWTATSIILLTGSIHISMTGHLRLDSTPEHRCRFSRPSGLLPFHTALVAKGCTEEVFMSRGKLL